MEIIGKERMSNGVETEPGKADEVDISQLPDVTPETFGRFWPLLKKFYRLRKINGVNLVDFFYATNPNMTSRKMGVRGIDYFSPEEFISELNTPHRKKEYSSAFLAYIPILEHYTKLKKERAAREASLKKQHPAKFGLQGSANSKTTRSKAKATKSVEKKGAESGADSESESSSSALFSSDESSSTDSSSDEGDDGYRSDDKDKSSSQSRSDSKSRAKTKTTRKGKAGRPGRKRGSSSRRVVLHGKNFHPLWEHATKIYGFKKFPGDGRFCPHYYSLNPDLHSLKGAKRQVDYFNQGEAIVQLNRRRDEFPEVFNSYREVMAAYTAQREKGKKKRKHVGNQRRASKRNTRARRGARKSRPTSSSSGSQPVEVEGKVDLQIGAEKKDETVTQFIKTVEAYKRRRLADSLKELEEIEAQLKDLQKRKKKIQAYVKRVEVLKLTSMEDE